MRKSDLQRKEKDREKDHPLLVHAPNIRYYESWLIQWLNKAIRYLDLCCSSHPPQQVTFHLWPCAFMMARWYRNLQASLGAAPSWLEELGRVSGGAASRESLSHSISPWCKNKVFPRVPFFMVHWPHGHHLLQKRLWRESLLDQGHNIRWGMVYFLLLNSSVQWVLRLINLSVKRGNTKPNAPLERNFNVFMAEKFKFYSKSLKSL